MILSVLAVDWIAYAQRNTTADLQDWRQHGTTETFTLVGQVRKSFSQTGLHQLTGAEAGDIIVQQGDVLGFYSPALSTISYNYGTCGTDP